MAPAGPSEAPASDPGMKDSGSPETLGPSEGEVVVGHRAFEVELWSPQPEDLGTCAEHLDLREVPGDSLVRGCSMGEGSQRLVLARVRFGCCCRSPATKSSSPSLP